MEIWLRWDGAGGLGTNCPRSALSGVHFTLELREGQVVLRDLGSTNGTFVNGVRLQVCFLKDWDVIAAGQKFFRLQMQNEILDPLAVLFAESEPLYAVLDAAREARVLQLLRLF